MKLFPLNLLVWSSLLCVVVRASASRTGVQGSIADWVTQTTLKMVVMASLLGTQGCGKSITTDASFSGYTIPVINQETPCYNWNTVWIIVNHYKINICIYTCIWNLQKSRYLIEPKNNVQWCGVTIKKRNRSYLMLIL